MPGLLVRNPPFILLHVDNQHDMTPPTSPAGVCVIPSALTWVDMQEVNWSSQDP